MDTSDPFFDFAQPADSVELVALHDATFGPGCYTRAAYRVREQRPADPSLSMVCRLDGQIVAANHLTPILIGQRPGALLLGPLAVIPPMKNRGYGKTLVIKSLDMARDHGYELVILVGDQPYYGKLGFQPVPPGQITMPAPIDPTRLLAAELTPGSLANFRGRVKGAPEERVSPQLAQQETCSFAPHAHHGENADARMSGKPHAVERQANRHQPQGGFTARTSGD